MDSAQPPGTPSVIPPSPCPSCGHNLPLPSPARLRIQDLEAQVKLLNSKAAAAVDKIADYEDEVRFLRAQNNRLNQNTPPENPTLQSQLYQVGRLTSLTSLLGRRRNPSGNTNEITPTTPARTDGGSSAPSSTFLTPAAAPPTQHSNASTPVLPSVPPKDFPSPPLTRPATSHGPAPTSHPSPHPQPLQQQNHHQEEEELTLHTLRATLNSERQLRLHAESSLTQTQQELEELTAQLFGQANEMVAQERRERKRLEERVGVLERREREKGERLKKLEERVGRVERVRGMLGGGGGQAQQQQQQPIQEEVEAERAMKQQQQQPIVVVAGPSLS